MRKSTRIFLLLLILLAVWSAIVRLADIPDYILPGPSRVLEAWINNSTLLLDNAAVTLAEILLGMLLGIIFGALSALLLMMYRSARLWLLPLLVASQALPVFALAPILILWLGYGMASKVAMASLIIFFPVCANFYDGLRRSPRPIIEMSQMMTSRQSSWRSRLRILLLIRLPSALPSAASGLRIAAATAPIGAIVGEWVGSGAGLGYIMLRSNARVEIDLMFAALLSLAVMAVALYWLVDAVLRRIVTWSNEEETHDQ